MPTPESETSPNGVHASRRRLLDLIEFDQEAGSITFAGRRMLMLHADVFSALRRDLVHRLGMDIARRVITQMGYTAGVLDAQLVKQMRSGLDPLQGFMLGPEIFAIEGFGPIDVLRIELGQTAAEHSSEFTWENSPEADMHIEAYGLGDAPACWMEVGYASGFVSAFFDKPIIVHEIECRAMGHAECKNISEVVDTDEEARAALGLLPGTNLRDLALSARGSSLETTQRPLARAGSGKISAVGTSVPFLQTLDQINRVASTNATVLLLGESGVGKSLLAREVHKASKRSEGLFVEVNCAAIPEQLLEAELFGVEAGAFTGAIKSRGGRFQIADGGTLFLDEIALLPLTAQGKLLRVLQSGEFEKLGSNTTNRVDVRVVAATNSDLRKAVEDGVFREDLYYRIAVFPIEIPPLRARKDDIPDLLKQCLTKFATRHERKVSGLTKSALKAIYDYDWPGNIREFENVLERALILVPNGELIDVPELSGSGVLPYPGQEEANQLASYQQTGSPPASPTLMSHIADVLDLNATWSEVEQALISAAMTRAGGNVSRAAAALGLTRPQLAYRLKSLPASLD